MPVPRLRDRRYERRQAEFAIQVRATTTNLDRATMVLRQERWTRKNKHFAGGFARNAAGVPSGR